SIPTTVRRRTCPVRPAASPQNVRNDRSVKHGRSAPKSAANEAGRVGSGSIGGSPPKRRYQAPPMLLHPPRPINAPPNPATPPVIIAAYRKRIRRPRTHPQPPSRPPQNCETPVRRRAWAYPLVAAVFRTNRRLRERYAATCLRRRRPGQVRRRRDGFR